MGRRMGLARIEALLEAVDRDLNLANTTLTSPTVVSAAGLSLLSETIDTDGATIHATTPVTVLNHDGDEAVVLADGTVVGQMKIILSSTNNTVTNTPVTLAGASTTIATTNIGEAYTLVWGGTDGRFVVSRSAGANAGATAVAGYPVLA